jgi:hypothetical protein
MSETAKKLFERMNGIKEAVQATLPGLRDLVPEAKAELSRIGTQGAMELASGLFNGHAFVPYGPGQYTPTPEHEQDRGMER